MGPRSNGSDISEYCSHVNLKIVAYSRPTVESVQFLRRLVGQVIGGERLRLWCTYLNLYYILYFNNF